MLKPGVRVGTYWGEWLGRGKGWVLFMLGVMVGGVVMWMLQV